jgi:hypothetical protein
MISKKIRHCFFSLNYKIFFPCTKHGILNNIVNENKRDVLQLIPEYWITIASIKTFYLKLVIYIFWKLCEELAFFERRMIFSFFLL